jgi:type IV pilus assembly protein PilY1
MNTASTSSDSTLLAPLCLDISDVPLDTQSLASPAGDTEHVSFGGSVSVNGETLHAGTVIYQAQYSSAGWTGDVKAYPVDQESGMVLMDMPIWSAQGLLDGRNWDTGRLIATFDGDEGVPFRFSELTERQKSALDPVWSTGDGIGKERLEYLRGNKAKETANGGNFRTRVSLMGDIVHSSPVYQDGALYIGGNDGMLHALDASDGEELFAYVPNLVFHNLRDLTSPAYEHHYFVDLTPAIQETGNGVYLAGGLGRGGRGFYCLNISNPFEVYSEARLASKVMWEYPRLSTPETESLDIGYSYSVPSIVNSNEGWVVIFGNGYSSHNQNAVLFVLDLPTGVCIARIDTGVGGCNGLSTPIVVDTNNDAKVDYAYAGDLKGNLWKFDLTGCDASNWEVAYSNGTKPQPLFQARDGNGTPQPITTRPDVMYHCSRSLPGYIVVIGTGKYLGNTDISDFSTQTVYGIWDYGDDGDDSEYLGRFERGAGRQLSNQPEMVGLLEQVEACHEMPGGRYFRVLSDFKPDWVTGHDEDDGQAPNPSCSVENHAGWFFDLPLPKERVVRDPIIRNGEAIVISNILKSPSRDPGGNSIVHEINACTGGRLKKPKLDISGGGVIGEDDMIEIPELDNPGGSIKVVPTGILFPSIVYFPRILRMADGTDMEYFSSDDGNVVSLKKTGEKRGFYYWRHID